MPKNRKEHRCPEKYNLDWQEYKTIPIRLILYTEEHFSALRAKRFLLGKSGNQNIWIPNRYLLPDGTLMPGADLDWLFRKAKQENKFRYAGIREDVIT